MNKLAKERLGSTEILEIFSKKKKKKTPVPTPIYMLKQACLLDQHFRQWTAKKFYVHISEPIWRQFQKLDRVAKWCERWRTGPIFSQARVFKKKKKKRAEIVGRHRVGNVSQASLKTGEVCPQVAYVEKTFKEKAPSFPLASWAKGNESYFDFFERQFGNSSKK